MEHIKLQKYNAPFRVSIQKKVSEDIAYAALWRLLSHRVREGCRERHDLYYCNGQYVNSDKNMYQMSLLGPFAFGTKTKSTTQLLGTAGQK